MEPISVRGTLTKPELERAIRYTLWRRSGASKFFFFLGCFLTVFGIANAFWQGAGSLPIVVPGLTLLTLTSISPKLSARRQLKMLSNFSEQGVYEFDESQFRIIWPSLQVSRPWSSLHSAVELKDLFLIFTAKVIFHPIPKRFFEAEQLSSFRDLLQRVLPEHGKQLLR